MKKIFKLLIAFFVLFSLSSCNPQGKEKSGIIGGTTYTVYEKLPYNQKYEVAVYIDKFHKLPSNYFSKSSTKLSEWTEENLYAIGGDVFQNREGRLPKGKTYTECDIDSYHYNRGAKRIVFSNEYEIWYTGDHYKSFERIVIE